MNLTLKIIIGIIMIYLINYDVKQRNEKKGWVVISAFIPVSVILYIFMRKPKSEKLKAQEGLNGEIKFISSIIIGIVLILYYAYYIDPIHSGEDYNLIAQKYTLGVAMFCIILIIGLIKRDSAIVALGLILTSFTLLISFANSIERGSKKDNISITYEKEIFKIPELSN